MSTRLNKCHDIQSKLSYEYCEKRGRRHPEMCHLFMDQSSGNEININKNIDFREPIILETMAKKIISRSDTECVWCLVLVFLFLHQGSCFLQNKVL